MSSNLHLAWADLLVRSLAGAGVRDAVVSPGSRSTPLALALARPDAPLRSHVIIDERSAAFFALGQARVTGRPSLLVCTSGTAAAHYFPAVIEASESGVPLIVVTADRPWELAHASAPQTIDQLRLYGDFVRFFADLGQPDPSPGALAALPRIAAQAAAASLAPTPGPVHLNARFRKPLEPAEISGPEPWEAQVRALLSRGATRVIAGRPAVSDAAANALADRLASSSRGLLVAGPSALVTTEDRAALFALAEACGFPLLAEATSQLRFGDALAEVDRVGPLDLVLRSPAARSALAPDLVVQLGAPPTSTGFAELVAGGPARIVIALHGWNDPSSDAEALVFAGVADVARALTARLPGAAARVDRRSAWRDAWRRADALARGSLEAELASPTLTEGQVARAVVAGCPAGSILAVGNSAPVRDLDLWCPPGGRALDVLHQRGASGIDGLVSGIAGACSVADRPVALLLGDVSMAHDIGALGLLRAAGPPCAVVVVDNGGGRIFETLPIARAVTHDILERFYATPPGIDWAQAAAAFGVPFAQVDTRAALAAALEAAFAGPGATLIVARVPPHDAAPRVARVRAHFDAAFRAASPFELPGETS